MRRLSLLCALLLFAGPATLSGSTVRVLDIGLNGFYELRANPTVVRVVVSSSEKDAQDFDVVFIVHDLKSDLSTPKHEFHLKLRLEPSEQRTLEVPLLLAGGYEPVLDVELRDGAKETVAKNRYPLDGSNSEEYVATLLCADQKACQAAQTAISFGGSHKEQNTKQGSLRFVSLKEAPDVWWAYGLVDWVVLAMPVAQISTVQRMAIELYVRQGGQLVIVDDLAHDPSFLAPYVTGGAKGNGVIMGRGVVFTVPSTSSPEFSAVFDRFFHIRTSLNTSTRLNYSSPIGRDELGWVVKRLGTKFRFPSLTYLLFGLIFYILVVGVLNFTILQRVGRREWGWITVPATAVIFALGVFAAGYIASPKQTGLDTLAVYWMDENSSIAGASSCLRISSADKVIVTPTLPGNDFVFQGEGGTEANFSSGVTNLVLGWTNRALDVEVGPPFKISLPLLQWSWRDLEFQGTHQFPGTVRRVSATRLRNETGQNFSQTMYLDKTNVYFLGPLASNGEIDLTSAKKELLSANTGRMLDSLIGFPMTLKSDSEIPSRRDDHQSNSESVDYSKQLNEVRNLSSRPFALVEMIRSWPDDGGRVFDTRSGVFLGLSDEPSLGASLAGRPAGIKNHALTIVSFGRTP
jgi:hypothetical protein